VQRTLDGGASRHQRRDGAVPDGAALVVDAARRAQLVRHLAQEDARLQCGLPAQQHRQVVDGLGAQVLQVAVGGLAVGAEREAAPHRLLEVLQRVLEATAGLVGAREVALLDPLQLGDQLVDLELAVLHQVDGVVEAATRAVVEVAEQRRAQPLVAAAAQPRGQAPSAGGHVHGGRTGLGPVLDGAEHIAAPLVELAQHQRRQVAQVAAEPVALVDAMHLRADVGDHGLAALELQQGLDQGRLVDAVAVLQPFERILEGGLLGLELFGQEAVALLGGRQPSGVLHGHVEVGFQHALGALRDRGVDRHARLGVDRRLAEAGVAAAVAERLLADLLR